MAKRKERETQSKNAGNAFCKLGEENGDSPMMEAAGSDGPRRGCCSYVICYGLFLAAAIWEVVLVQLCLLSRDSSIQRLEWARGGCRVGAL